MELLERRLHPNPAGAPEDAVPEEGVADGGRGYYVLVTDVVEKCLPTSAHVSGKTLT